jgi:tRNA modification GTPase
MLNQQDTIASMITAPGIGAMGSIRISGPQAFFVAQKVFRSKKGIEIQDMPPYSLNYGLLYLDDILLDQALLLKMQGPHSFTGEDVIELQTHGGPLVLSRLLQALADEGVRLAMPGEFSQRAFLNGKMDLSQAEAVMDLVSASNKTLADAAAAQVQGSLSDKITQMKTKIISWIAAIEAEIDFPEEEIAALDRSVLSKEIAMMLRQIDDLLATADFGRIYREGLRLVFYGRPNVGKSSLLNGLLKKRRAIVTAEAGTTRDVLEERFFLEGIPIILMDTAGIRESNNEAEQEGIARAQAAAQEADLILFVLDLAAGYTAEDRDILETLDPQKTLVIANKADLVNREAASIEQLDRWQISILSAFEQSGIDELSELIKTRFEKGHLIAGNTEVFINRRQEYALIQSKNALEGVLESLLSDAPSDFLSIDLQSAWSALGEITGETVKDALVSEIFSRFCLGK